MQRPIKWFLATALVGVLAQGPAWALDPIPTGPLVGAVTPTKMRVHLQALAAIANQNDRNRSVGTSGYAESARYVRQKLEAAGYDVRYQNFTALLFEEHTPPNFQRIQPSPVTYDLGDDFLTMTYSGAGDVTAPMVLAKRIRIPPPAVAGTTQSGCQASDFENAAGRIVLVQRGFCTFFEKANFAAQAGAVAVVIFNEGQPGRKEALAGTLGEELPIPVIGTSFAVGRRLVEMHRGGQAPIRLRVDVDAETSPTDTVNVLAEKPGAVSNRAVVVGAHLDSVPEGPGINDNGSGTAAILTIAEEIARLGINPRNTLRFAFWGAEEGGLFGSNYYVATLTDAQLSKVFVNLNFDMLGSPNYVRFVYDGDGTLGTAGPPGSDVIEEVLVDFLADRDLESEPTPFDGRSDYLAFIQNGIPAGGLFSGAEGVKTAEQAAIYGGLANRPYDPCYHEFCDNINNINATGLSELGKAAAHAVLTFAQTREQVPPPSPAQVAAAKAAAAKAEYRGSRLVR